MSAVRLGPRPPPVNRRGALGWARVHLFAGPIDSVITLAVALVLATTLPQAFAYMITDAFWTGQDRNACLDHAGYCWPFLFQRFNQILYGAYPEAARWRADLAFAFLVAFALASLALKGGRRYGALIALAGLWPILAAALLAGGIGNLEPVPTQLWGGFLLTALMALSAISASLPLGIALALARRSDLPLVRWLAVIVIEVVRGVPLITVLFMSSLMLPYFLPAGVVLNNLTRAMIGFALFAAAYMAEVVRGGLDNVPKGQAEAASALGLSPAKTMILIILPQALRLSIPNIVSTFIALLKDTTLVMIVGLMDLLAATVAAWSDANWAGPNTAQTGYIFVGAVFWLLSFALSRAAARIEGRLARGGQGKVR